MAESEDLSTIRVAGVGYAAMHMEDGCRVLCIDSTTPQVGIKGAGRRGVNHFFTARIDLLIVTLSTVNQTSGSDTQTWRQLCQLRLDATLAGLGSS